jgi:YHS domain-containing protein
MRNLVFKALLMLGIAILFSSCMMMGPGHMAGGHQMTPNHTRSQGYFDPVCGNQIEIVQDEITWQYEGKVYYFHSSDCMEEFKKTPEKYIHHNHNNHQGEKYRNIFLWGIGGLAMGAMMILMLL